MTQELILFTIQFGAFYFVFISIMYAILIYLSWLSKKRFNNRTKVDFQNGVSFVIPLFNEESLVVETIQTYSKLQMQKEIILVNDGSSDKSLNLIFNMFQMKKGDNSTYQSITFPELKLLNLPHAGKAKALNKGIEHAKYEIICTMDADTIPNPEGVHQSFSMIDSNKKIMALGGVIHILKEPTLLNFLQRLEYLRTFICERLGWSVLGATTLISGAFCMFRKSGWTKIGGFREDSITEDLDFIIRLRKEFKNAEFPVFPISTCQTQVPKTLSHLKNQRIRWHVGLIDTLKQNFTLCFNATYGSFSMLGLMYLLFIEALSPIMQILLWFCIPYAVIQGWLPLDIVLLYLGAGLIFSVILTLIGQGLDSSFKENIFKTIIGTLMLSLGYKQLTGIWRFCGFFKFVFSNKIWGAKPRYEISTN